jgi:hypothetical protein
MNWLDFAGAEILDNPHRPRVLQPLGTGHVCGSIGAIGTQQPDNLRLEIFHSRLHGIDAIYLMPQHRHFVDL